MGARHSAPGGGKETEIGRAETAGDSTPQQSGGTPPLPGGHAREGTACGQSAGTEPSAPDEVSTIEGGRTEGVGSCGGQRLMFTSDYCMPFDGQGSPRSRRPLYNVNIVKFMDAQLEKLRCLEKPPSATTEQVANFNLDQRKGRRLVNKHKSHFRIKDFYRTREACPAVETICKRLKETLSIWGLEAQVSIQVKIPIKDVGEDEALLCKLLSFVLKDVQCNVGRDLLHSWEGIKQRHKEEMKLVQVIDETELQVGESPLGMGGQGAVYKAVWQSTDVAVKKPLGEGHDDLPVEKLAEHYREIIVHAGINHHIHIVGLLATTTSGWIVMELADSDLHTLCYTSAGLAWKYKVRLFHQGCVALAYLHSQDKLHGDIKLENFLVFGTDPQTCHLKISDFGLTAEVRVSRNWSIRPGGGTLEYTAPECLDEKPTSPQSDVYSFGVLCYEVTSGQRPYSGLCAQSRNAAILAKKARGEDPCQVEPKDCPQAMLELMRRCCATDPVNRPTMEEVKESLQQMPEQWNIAEHLGSKVYGKRQARQQQHGEATTANIQLHCATATSERLDNTKGGKKGQRRPQGPLYNMKIMDFLDEQLEKLWCFEVPASVTEKQLAFFERQLGKGRRLFVKHTSHFDMRDFYSTSDACAAVEEICWELRETVEAWGLQQEVDIKVMIPRTDVADDEKLLGKLLSFILMDVPCDVERELLHSWEGIKQRHKESMKWVQVIDEAEIQMKKRLGRAYSRLYQAVWQSANVAVKRAPDAGDPFIETLARRFKDICFHTDINSHPHVIRLLAMTPSGWKVMELADCDLYTMCYHRVGMSWKTKARLLLQGGTALLYLHSQRRVHGNVKLQNFLVFGTDLGTCHLKISDFEFTAVERISRTKTVRLGGGVGQYAAPESFDGKPTSLKSDVYSFGVMCYALISGQRPYDGGNEYAIMSQKLHGIEPCQVQYGDCPPAALALVRQCCATDPACRPTMEEVCDTLRQLCYEWDGGEHASEEDERKLM